MYEYIDGQILTRTDVLNYLVRKCNYKSYLEIGVHKGKNFKRIECELKHGVDPQFPATFNMKSDQYFKVCDRKYDLIFIDGNHTAPVVLRDIRNSLKCLNENGIILVHDMSPSREKLAQRKPKEGVKTWYGDGYKTLIVLRSIEPYLFIRTIDVNHGIGIIKPVKEKQELIEVPKKITYSFMDSDRQKTLGLISVDEFLKLEL